MPFLLKHGSVPVKEGKPTGVFHGKSCVPLVQGRTTLVFSIRRRIPYSLIGTGRVGHIRKLTEEQKKAMVKQSYSGGKGKEVLRATTLKGWTGSGKTEVYVRSADQALGHGGGCLSFPSPRKSRSRCKMVFLFCSSFGEEVVYIHSQLQQRWNDITTA